MAAQQEPLPPELPGLVAGLRHPDVHAFQLTTTAEGGWAVAAHVKRQLSAQLKSELAGRLGKHRLLVVEGDEPIQEARPAYPERGE